jgi:hypothetical protein
MTGVGNSCLSKIAHMRNPGACFYESRGFINPVLAAGARNLR